MSTRLEYSIESLREQIASKRDRRIAQAVAEYESAIDLAKARDEWRGEQEKRIRSLARRLASAADNELESFRVKPCPRNDSWRTPEQHRDEEVQRANERFEHAIGRLDALRTKDGSVALTPTMLRDWFSL